MAGTRGVFVAALTAFVLLTAPLPGFADFAINIVGPGAYGGAGITILDNSPQDLNPALGGITTFAGLSGLPVVPGFAFSINSALTNSPGSASGSTVSLNWLLSSITAGTLQVTASATGFTLPAAGTASGLISGIAGTLSGSGSVTGQQWVDLGNLLFGLGAVTPGPQGPFTTAVFADSEAAGFIASTPYSITDRVILTLGPGATTNGSLQSTVVPEPITMFLGGTGLLMLGYAARRRLFGR